MKLCFFDTETTGLNHDHHEMISYAVILHDQDEEIYRHHQKITPLRIHNADPVALQVNKYTPRKWKDSIHPSNAAIGLRRFFLDNSDMIIVGHNPMFDVRFSEALIREYDPDFKIKNHCIDTKCLALATLYPLGLLSCKLDAIREFLDWPTSGAHDALVDAEHVRDLFFLCRRDLTKMQWKFLDDRIEYT
jgi:DNA polymerase III alpha subunit (gram-positive type)